MTYLFSMLAVLVAGVSILMLGILMDREPGQRFTSSLNHSLVWGMGFFISFGAEFLSLIR